MEYNVDLSSHSVDTIVITCVDFRYREALARWISEKFVQADLFSLPGASKAILEASVVVDWLKMIVDLHHVLQIVIVDHIDCGAYGGSKKFDSDSDAEIHMHVGQLEKARQLLMEKLPGVKIVTTIFGPQGEVGEVHG